MRRHVWLRWRASKSIAMAAFQCGSLRVDRVELGMGEMAGADDEVSMARAYRGLGLKMPALEHVCI